jgi:hypothetical protein
MVVGHDAQMRTYLANLPRWALGLISGFTFGTAMGIFTKIDGPTSWTEAVVGGVIMGVLFGAVMAFSIDKRRREMRVALGDLPADKSRAARRAADRGPIPADAEVRAAALRIAGHQLDLFRRARGRSVVVIVLLMTSTVGLVVSGSPWYVRLLNALTPLLMLIGYWYWPRRIRKRIELLSEGANVITE